MLETLSTPTGTTIPTYGAGSIPSGPPSQNGVGPLFCAAAAGLALTVAFMVGAPDLCHVCVSSSSSRILTGGAWVHALRTRAADALFIAQKHAGCAAPPFQLEASHTF